jgi:hypothetical protein
MPEPMLFGDVNPEAAASELAALIGLQDAEKQDYLAEQLTSLHFLSGSLQSVSVGGTASQREEDAQSIESACKRILSFFAITDRDFKLEEALATSPIASVLAFQIAQIIRRDRYYHSPIVDEESRDRITAILDGIMILRDAARRAREQAEKQKVGGLGGNRRKKDWPLNEMAWHILRLYIELTGRRPGVSKSQGTNKIGGPAVRFLDAMLRWLGWKIKRTTAANLIDKLKNDEGLKEALDNPIFKSE